MVATRKACNPRVYSRGQVFRASVAWSCAGDVHQTGDFKPGIWGNFRMSGLLGRSRRRVTICLTLLVVGGIALVAIDRHWVPFEHRAGADQATDSGTLSPGDLSAYDTVALRFPADLPDETGSLTGMAAPRVMDGPQFNLFDPNPLSAQTPAAVKTEPAPSRDAVPPPSAEIRMASVAPASVAAAPKPLHHVARGRPNAVLNDAQIATIKKRLKLTPDQEQMWPAVEVALRNMSYSKKQPNGSSPAAKQLASIDPEGTDVQNLKSAAVPLLMSFNNEQKREVRSIVQVIGLDKLATQL